MVPKVDNKTYENYKSHVISEEDFVLSMILLEKACVPQDSYKSDKWIRNNNKNSHLTKKKLIRFC